MGVFDPYGLNRIIDLPRCSLQLHLFISLKKLEFPAFRKTIFFTLNP